MLFPQIQRGVTERGAGGHGWARHAAQQVGSLAELPPGLRGRGGPVVLQFCAGVQLLAHARVVAGEGRVLRNHGGVLGELSGCRPVSLPLTLTGSAAGRNLRLDSRQPRLCAARWQMLDEGKVQGDAGASQQRLDSRVAKFFALACGHGVAQGCVNFGVMQVPRPSRSAAVVAVNSLQGCGAEEEEEQML